MWKVTRNATLVILTKLEQHKRRLDSRVNTEEKKIERPLNTKREIVREKSLRGQKTSGRKGRSFT